MSVSQLALAVGIPIPTLSRIESRQLRASAERQRLLAEALDVDADVLFEPAEGRALDGRDREVAEAYRSGVRMSELVARYGLDRSTLGRIVDRHGGRTRGLEEAQVDDIARLYAEGSSGPEIAATLKIPRSTVYYHLGRRGIERRPSNQPRKHPAATPRPCLRCGSVFRPDAYRIARGWGKFCTRRCARGYEPARLRLSANAKKRYARAAAELVDLCTRRGLLTVRDVANDLMVAEHSVSGRYIRSGILPAEKVTLHAWSFWLIEPEDLRSFKRAWLAAGGSALEARMKWLNADFVVRTYEAKGLLERLALAKSISVADAEAIIRDRVRRRVQRYGRRRGRPKKTEMKTRLLETYKEALEALENASENELFAYVALLDWQRSPADWQQAWASPLDPESYDPRYRKPALERVRWLIGDEVKRLQAPARKIA